MAQPSDLMNPIPQSGPQTVNIDIQRAPASQPPQQPQPANGAIDPALQTAMGASTPVAPPSQGGVDPDLLAALGETGMQLPDRFAVGANEQGNLGDTGQDPGILASFIQGFGRSPQEDALLLEKVYGQGNVKVQNKKIFFREPGQKNYQSIESDKLGLAAKVINQVARGSGIALEAVTGAGPAAVGMALGGPVAGVMGGAAGGVAGSAAREGAVSALLGSERALSDVAPGSEMTMGGVLGGAGSAVGMALGRLGRSLYQGSEAGRISRVANIRSALEEVKQNLLPEHWSSPTAGPALKGKEAQAALGSMSAESYNNIISRESDRLGQQVRAARNQLVENAGDAKFSMTNTADSLGSILKEYEGRGLSFDKNTGKASLSTEIPASSERGPIAPFGIQGGEGVLNQVTNMYNTLIDAQKNGGVSAGDVIDLTRKIEDLAKFDQSVQKSKVFPWREATQAAIQDRDALARSVLDPQSLQRYEGAYQEYTNKIDAVRGLSDQVSKALQSESRADLIDSLVAKNNPKLFRDFKMIAGPEAANEVRANFVTHLIDKHIDDSSGLFKSDAFLNDLKSYGPELIGSPKVSGEILDRSEYRQLVHIASKMREIETGDLVRKKSALNSIINSPFFAVSSVRQQGLTLAKVLRASPQNEKMLSELVDQAIDKAPKKEVERLLGVRDAIEESWRLRSAKALAGSSVVKGVQTVLEPNRTKQESFQ